MLLSHIVLPEGNLDDTKVVERDALYKGSNGKYVERFTIQTELGIRSYIFKPLTNLETMGREQWIHEHILSLLSSVKTPKIVSVADHGDPERYWAIFEDCGTLSHNLSEAELSKVAAKVPHWHEIPLHAIPDTFSGNKPGYETILQTVEEKWHTFQDIVRKLGVSEKSIVSFRDTMNHLPSQYFQEMALSHGDFHRGNIAIMNDEVIVLDWEHTHKNSIFWDLYNLIDITHPYFRRQTTPSIRTSVLDVYFSTRTALGWKAAKSEFEYKYHCYSLIHSAWMLLLIADDLEKGRWPTKDLLAAQEETLQSFTDCLSYLQS